jgi:hypothetical protein
MKTKNKNTSSVVPTPTPRPAAPGGVTLGLDLGDHSHYACVLEATGQIRHEGPLLNEQRDLFWSCQKFRDPLKSLVSRNQTENKNDQPLTACSWKSPEPTRVGVSVSSRSRGRAQVAVPAWFSFLR